LMFEFLSVFSYILAFSLFHFDKHRQELRTLTGLFGFGLRAKSAA